ARPRPEFRCRTGRSAQKLLGDFFVGLASVRAFHFLRELINLQAEILIMYGLLFEDVYTVTEKGCHLNTHCANVGLYNMVYGIQKKMEFDEIRDLGFGGMLIEVGMTLVPQKILDKQESLSPEEFKEIRKHPSLGRSILLDAKCCNSRVLRIVGEHHEKFNGEGYPGGFSDKKIFPLAKICSIMDVFDALTSERPYHKPVSPMEAFALMNDEMAGSFDNEILFNFMGLLGALVE
ncbi:MAG: HD-GYP domain-containing protein, partial [Nitrospinales bacterium]